MVPRQNLLLSSSVRNSKCVFRRAVAKARTSLLGQEKMENVLLDLTLSLIFFSVTINTLFGSRGDGCLFIIRTFCMRVGNFVPTFWLLAFPTLVSLSFFSLDLVDILHSKRLIIFLAIYFLHNWCSKLYICVF